MKWLLALLPGGLPILIGWRLWRIYVDEREATGTPDLVARFRRLYAIPNAAIRDPVSGVRRTGTGTGVVYESERDDPNAVDLSRVCG